MQTALEQVCQNFPARLGGHEARKQVAEKILARVASGSRSLEDLTEAARVAAARLYVGEVVERK